MHGTVDNSKKPIDDNTMAEFFAAMCRMALARRKNPRDSIHVSRGHANQYLLALGECDPSIPNMIWAAFDTYPGTCAACVANRHLLIFNQEIFGFWGSCVCEM